MISHRCVSRSSNAVVILASANTALHSPKDKLVVTISAFVERCMTVLPCGQVEQVRLHALRDFRLPEADPPREQAAAGAKDQAADDVEQPTGQEIVTHGAPFREAQAQ